MENVTIYANFRGRRSVLFEVKADTQRFGKQEVMFESILYGECVKYLKKKGFAVDTLNDTVKALLNENIKAYEKADKDYDENLIGMEERDFRKDLMVRLNRSIIKGTDSKCLLKMMYNRFIRANKKSYESDFYIYDMSYIIDKKETFVWICREHGSNIVSTNHFTKEAFNSYLDYHIRHYKQSSFYIVNLKDEKIKRMNLENEKDIKEMQNTYTGSKK